MRRLVVTLLCLVFPGCQPKAILEPVNRVTLSAGLEVTWLPEAARSEKRAASSLVIQLRSVGEGPVVVCRVLPGDGQGSFPPVLFVQHPEPGTFRYEPSSDSIVAETHGGSPFHLAPAFRWYGLVLHPGAKPVTLELSPAEAGSPVLLLVEYLPLSYIRLVRVAYVPPEGPPAKEQGEDAAREPDRVLHYRRASEAELRRRRPAQLFLRTSALPRPVRTPIEIPLGTTP